MHHAIAYVRIDPSRVVLPAQCAEPGVDVIHHDEPTLTIASVRSLIGQAYRRPVAAEEIHIVIKTRRIPVEAQQALLKILEEPPATTRFHIVVPNLEHLLPTVRSRLAVAADESPDTAPNEVFLDFARATYADRLQAVLERTKAKDRAWMDAVVRGAETYAATALPERSEAARAVILNRRYLETAGASSKLLLEELALSLPILRR